MQEVLVILVVSVAVFFIGRMIYKQFFVKEVKCESCAVGKMVEK